MNKTLGEYYEKYRQHVYGNYSDLKQRRERWRPGYNV